MVLGENPLIVSNCIQSTAHAILVLTVCFLKEEFDAAGIWYVPIIADLHDESINQIKAVDKDKARAIIQEKVMPRLNKFLGGNIPLKIEVTITDNLADIKCEE